MMLLPMQNGTFARGRNELGIFLQLVEVLVARGVSACAGSHDCAAVAACRRFVSEASTSISLNGNGGRVGRRAR